MFLISYFSINTAAATAVVQSHDQWLHYATHSDIHLAVTQSPGLFAWTFLPVVHM